MNLFPFRFDRSARVTALPPDLAVLMVQVAARQASSPTATSYARAARAPLGAPLFAPLDGAFNGPVARTLMKWKDE